MWMLECQDLWGLEDDDADDFFVECSTGYHDNDYIEKLDLSSEKILGIYDLARPLKDQGPGLTLEEWKAR